MSYEQAKARSEANSRGSDGYLRLDQGGTPAYIVVDLDHGPWYREETWPDGEHTPTRARMGSHLYPVWVEIPVWAYDEATKKWTSKLLDAKESALPELFAAVGAAGAVLRVRKVYTQSARNRTYRVLTIHTEGTGRTVPATELTDDRWPAPRGITLDEASAPAPAPTPSVDVDLPF